VITNNHIKCQNNTIFTIIVPISDTEKTKKKTLRKLKYDLLIKCFYKHKTLGDTSLKIKKISVNIKISYSFLVYTSIKLIYS